MNILIFTKIQEDVLVSASWQCSVCHLLPKSTQNLPAINLLTDLLIDLLIDLMIDLCKVLSIIESGMIAKAKRSGLRGQPCGVPLDTEKGLHLSLLVIILDLSDVFNICIMM